MSTTLFMQMEGCWPMYSLLFSPPPSHCHSKLPPGVAFGAAVKGEGEKNHTPCMELLPSVETLQWIHATDLTYNV